MQSQRRQPSGFDSTAKCPRKIQVAFKDVNVTGSRTVRRSCATEDLPKRNRRQFSLRSFAKVVCLVCVYLGAWNVTRTFGVTTNDTDSCMPFVVYATTHDWAGRTTRYYFWMFGIRIQIPIESYDE